MNNNARDTQFQGFAKALMSELLTHFGDFEDMEQLIARRAYDLVRHAQADPKDLDVLGFEEAIQRIPDMTELPDEWVVSKVEAFRKLCSPGVTFSEGPEPPKEQDE